jgi:tetratricopeptide (TPR) repeat protein
VQYIHASRSPEQIQQLRAAAEVYHGDLMAGFYVRGAMVFEEWLLLQREWFRQQAIQMFFTLGSYYTAHGEYTSAIEYTSRLLDIEPWHEESHRQLMFILARTGQRSQALARYEICHQTLSQELGVAPSEETTALYQQILDGQFQSSSHAAAFAPTPQRNTSHHLEPLPFVGRESEYTWLFEQWQAACNRQGQITLVAGDAGIGKTRLVEAVLHDAAGMGARLLVGRCAAFEQAMPYQSIGQVLRGLFGTDPTVFDALNPIWLLELTYLLPEIIERYPRLPQIPATHDDGARMRLFEAIAQVFAALDALEPATIVFLDDLHVVDPATTDLLRFLSDRLHHTAIWWVGTYRMEALSANPPMRRLQHDLTHAGRVAQLYLPPLDVSVIAHLVEHLAGLAREQADLLVEYLYTYSEGNVFILGQFLQELHKRGILCIRETGSYLDSNRLVQQSVALPAGVQALIQQWTQKLTPSARTLLDLAALIGRTFDLQVLERAADIPDAEFYRALELLQTHQLIREVDVSTASEAMQETRGGASRQPWEGSSRLHRADTLAASSARSSVIYEFTYYIVQQVLYAALSPGRYQQLCKQAGWAHVADTFKPMTRPIVPGSQECDILRKTA